MRSFSAGASRPCRNIGSCRSDILKTGYFPALRHDRSKPKVVLTNEAGFVDAVGTWRICGCRPGILLSGRSGSRTSRIHAPPRWHATPRPRDAVGRRYETGIASVSGGPERRRDPGACTAGGSRLTQGTTREGRLRRPAFSRVQVRHRPDLGAEPDVPVAHGQRSSGTVSCSSDWAMPGIQYALANAR